MITEQDLRQGDRPTERGGRRDRGAATLETVGMMIIAGFLAGALVLAATPQSRVISETFSYWICQVVSLGQGSCAPPSSTAGPDTSREPEEPCVLTQNGIERNTRVGVAVITTSDGRRLEVQELSDGTFRVTASAGAGGGGQVGIGGGLKLTVDDVEVGGSASAGASATLDFEGGQVYETDADGLDELMSALTQDQVMDDTVGDGGPLRWIADRGADALGVRQELPEPTETFAQGGVSLNASAEASGGFTTAGAGVGASQVLGTRTDQDGNTTVYLQSTVEGEAGLQTLGVDEDGLETQGASAEGELQLVTAVSFDSEGEMTNVTTSTTASGSSSGMATALFGGSGDVGLSETVSGARVHQAALDIDSSADADVANRFLLAQGVGALGGWSNPAALSEGVAATGSFFGAAADRGTLTQQDYTTDSSTPFAVEASGKIIGELGIEASVTQDSMETTGAQYWDGTQWVDWEACSG